MRKSVVYVLHFCKNDRCDSGWLGPDKYKAKTPVKTFYCESCIASGFPSGRQVDPEKQRRGQKSSDNLKR